MSEQLLNTVEDGEVRQFLRSNMDALAQEVQTEYDVVKQFSSDQQQQMLAAGESFDVLLKALIPGWDWEKVKAAIAKNVWVGFCEMKDGKGVARKEFQEIFDQEGIGRSLIDSAVVAAFTAVGGVLGGAFGAAVGGASGKKIQGLVTSFVASILDKAVEDTLKGYCGEVPQ